MTTADAVVVTPPNPDDPAKMKEYIQQLESENATLKARAVRNIGGNKAGGVPGTHFPVDPFSQPASDLILKGLQQKGNRYE
jgi:hypothetical protein